MRPMSQHDRDHDDPRPLADEDARLQTEDIANANQRTDDEPDRPMDGESMDRRTDDESMDRRMDDESMDRRMDDESMDRQTNDESMDRRMDDESMDRRMDDEPADGRSVADEYPTDEYQTDQTPRDEAQTRLDESPTEQLPTQEPVAGAPKQVSDDELAELFPQQEADQFRGEWQEIQARFVDDPRDAVQSADHLVAEVMRSLATTFTNHKHELEGQWQEGSDVETEDLRLALRRYRSFFNQLLNV